MKKLLIVLLALTVIGVFAFAQDAAPALQFTDSFSTGIQFTNNSPNSISLYDYWDNGKALYNDLDLTYAAGDWKWFAELDTADGTGPVWDALSLKGYFVNKIVAAELGMTANGDFTSLGDQGANNWWIKGGILTVAPISGLTIGYGLPLSIGKTGAWATDAFQGSMIGLAYSMDKMFAVKAEYLMALMANSSKFNASFALKAVDNLTFTAEVFASNIGATDKAIAAAPEAGPYSIDPTTGDIVPTTKAVKAYASGVTFFDETIAYTIGAIQPGVVAYEYLNAASNVASFSWNVKPYVNYTMDKTTFTANFKYLADKVVDSTKTMNHYVAQLIAKQAFDKATAWFGIEYADTDLSLSSDPGVVRVALSAAYSF